ncbi:MAG: hypothetical protein Phog2KO_49640 [Phototrophicaceae bacterium]
MGFVSREIQCQVGMDARYLQIAELEEINDDFRCEVRETLLQLIVVVSIGALID